MTVTPKNMARQMHVAQAARVERARVEQVFAQPRLAYSSTTGDAPRAQWVEPTYAAFLGDEDDAHCFICGRHTDHFAEHDDMVEAGYARYEDDNSVTWTEKGWIEYRA